MKRCIFCRQPIDMTLKYPDPMSPCRDHIRQKRDGGTNHGDNLRVVHLVCNARRRRAVHEKAHAPQRLKGYRVVEHAPSFTYYRPEN
jgi:hypothetical protein